MDNGTYILEDRTPVACDDMQVWGRWFKSTDRVVAKAEVTGKVISTVFIGIDHNFGGGAPHLFETMIFPSDNSCDDEYCERYATWDEAVTGHELAVALTRDRA